MDKVRVRYAPSPTGYLHIGNARTALFNYLFSQKQGGDFVVRIEDTDTARNLENGVASQLENLKWLGISWDESVDVGGPHAPYNQLSRQKLGIYDKYIDELLVTKKAYKCFCSSEELDHEAEAQKAAGKIPQYSGKCRNLSDEQIKEYEDNNTSYTVRFKVPENKTIKWNDIVKGEVSFNSKDVSGDFNIVKRDGIPAYNFVVVLDDHLMKMTHILRGEDHISNTPKQILIFEALDFVIPKFAHMTLIVNEEGKKLSKRDGGILQFIEQYKDLGYLPEAMFNFISLLGWSPEGEDEIFSSAELCQIFDVERLSKSPAKFDVNKLTWINNQYMKQISEENYFELVYPFLNTSYGVEKNIQTLAIAMLYKNQISYGAEISEVSELFFAEYKIEVEALEFLKEQEIENLNILRKNFESGIKELSDFDSQSIKGLIKEIQKETGIKGKNLFMPIRIMTTGQMHGPELIDAISIFGKEQTMKNIEKCFEALR